jgi:DNA helicase-2/ATP-dependent DNA helicase PcrA
MTPQLSPEQLRAVLADRSAIVVTASAGSGKTEVVARRIERLLDESPDESFRVLALSYTVKAADELRDRLARRLGDVRRVDTDTIHAFAHNLIRQHGTWEGLPPEPEVLYHDEDRVELLTEWLGELGTFLEPDHARSVLQELDLARARCDNAQYLAEYRDALAGRGALDYPSMLDVACRLLENEWLRTQISQTYRHLIVDEAQNLSSAQYRLLTAVLGPAPPALDAMLVGDEKQSIVQFAGADPTLIKRFSEEYSAEKIQLTKNFRSSTAIAAVAEAVTADLGDRSPLQVVSAAAGHVEFAVSPSERDEGIATARWIESVVADGLPATALAPGEDGSIHPEEVAVLARTGAALRWTAEALEDLGIEYVLGSDPRNWMSSRLGQAVADLVAYRAGPGHPSAQAHLVASAQAPVEDLESSPVPGLAALLAVSDGDNPAQLFAALAAADDIGDAEPQWLDDKDVLQRTWAAFLDRTPQNERTYINLQLEIARSQRGEPNAPGVRLLTVHKSQGREFRAVALVGMNDGQFPDFRQTTEKERRAELHCFYVAVTRASRVLRLSRARQRSGRNGLWDTRESEYLALARSAAK